MVTRAGTEVSLSPTEYHLLRYLMLNQDRVLSKEQILDHVWQYDFGGNGGIVETYIGYLRKKLDNAEPRLIHTVRGFGYVIRNASLISCDAAHPPHRRLHGPRCWSLWQSSA